MIIKKCEYNVRITKLRSNKVKVLYSRVNTASFEDPPSTAAVDYKNLAKVLVAPIEEYGHGAVA